MNDMEKNVKDRKGPYIRGYFKAAGMFLSLFFRLPVWAVKGALSRRHFRRELYAAGVPKKAAVRLSNRYKIRLWDDWGPAGSRA